MDMNVQMEEVEEDESLKSVTRRILRELDVSTIRVTGTVDAEIACTFLCDNTSGCTEAAHHFAYHTSDIDNMVAQWEQEFDGDYGAHVPACPPAHMPAHLLLSQSPTPSAKPCFTLPTRSWLKAKAMKTRLCSVKCRRPSSLPWSEQPSSSSSEGRSC